FAPRTVIQEIGGNRGDLVAEQQAVVIETTHASAYRHPGWANPSAGEDGNDDNVVAHPVPDVLRDYQRRPRLVRIAGLPGRPDRPDPASSGRYGRHTYCRRARRAVAR